ncbi:MAG: hypothetical protein LM558_03215 [Thermosphaera sp.]|nr:hypothetical protein [Thermosphaera sp.]
MNAYIKGEELVAELMNVQSILRGLIDEYGIKQGGKYNKTLSKLLTPPRLQSPVEWAEKN